MWSPSLVGSGGGGFVWTVGRYEVGPSLALWCAGALRSRHLKLIFCHDEASWESTVLSEPPSHLDDLLRMESSLIHLSGAPAREDPLIRGKEGRG